MSKFLSYGIVLLLLLSVIGCGSTVYHLQPPGSDAVASVAQEQAVQKDVTLVLLQQKRNGLYNAAQNKYLDQVKEGLITSGLFSVVAVDDSTFYGSVDDVPLPKDGSLLIGMTLKDEISYSPGANFVKDLANIATLTLSSVVAPYTADCTTLISLSVFDGQGLKNTYSSEASGQARWSAWTIRTLATRKSQRQIRQSAINGVLNKMSADLPPALKVSAL